MWQEDIDVNQIYEIRTRTTVYFGCGAIAKIDDISKELKAKGLNDSTEHIDFMIGTADLTVTGIEKDGTKTALFADGEWII